MKRYRTAGTNHLFQRAYIGTIPHPHRFISPISNHCSVHSLAVQTKLASEQAPANPAEFAAMHGIPYRKAIGAIQVNWAALAAHFSASHLPCPCPQWQALLQLLDRHARRRDSSISLLGQYSTRNLWLQSSEVLHTFVRSTEVDGIMVEDRHNARPYGQGWTLTSRHASALPLNKS